MVKPKNNMMNGKRVSKRRLYSTARNEKPFPLIKKEFKKLIFHS